MLGTWDMLYSSVLKTRARWKRSPPWFPRGRRRDVRRGGPLSTGVELVFFWAPEPCSRRVFPLPGEGLRHQAAGVDLPWQDGGRDGSP